MLDDPVVSVLGPDPTDLARLRDSRVHVLNGNAFQQDPIACFRGWQYACFYSPLQDSASSANASGSGGGDGEKGITSEGTATSESRVETVYVHLSRRKLPAGDWQTLVFDDYPQVTDDGHNTVQVNQTGRMPPF